VQGPVASYGGGPPAQGSPFQVTGPGMVSAPPAEAGSRVQSNRVYAILFAAFLMVCAAVAVAVWLKPPGGGGEEAVAAAEQKPVVDNASHKKRTRQVDTGAPEPAPEKAAPKKHTSSSTRSGTTTAAPAPARSSGPGPVTVRLTDTTLATAIEVVCPSGFRNRAALSGGVGTVQNVPQESCTLLFKGGAPLKYDGVRGGQTLTCTAVGSTASCK